MRMKHTYYILNNNYKALEGLKLSSSTQKIGSSMTYQGKVENWVAAREALEEVSKVTFFREFCLSILNNPFFAKTEDAFVIPYDIYQHLNPQYASFLSNIRAVLDFCGSVGFESVGQGFDIKMPPADSLDEFAKNIDMLNKAIGQCPYLNVDNEKILLKKTDIGSIWFEFAVAVTGTSVLLCNLAKVLDKCVKIKSHYVTVKQQTENLRQLQLKNDILQNMIEGFEESKKAVVSKLVQELQEEIPDTKLENEDVERVVYSLDTLSKLMEKGMEIYASIDAPPEIQELFPTNDEMTFLPKPLKLLENKEKKESNDQQ